MKKYLFYGHSLAMFAVLLMGTEAYPAWSHEDGSVQIEYVFPLETSGATSLTVMAFDSQRQQLELSLEQSSIESMPRTEKGQRLAKILASPQTYKLYFLFRDEHGILVDLRSISGLQRLEEVKNYRIPDWKTYKVNFPTVNVAKTTISVGEVIEPVVCFEDGYLRLQLRSGNEDILASCQHDLKKVHTANEWCFGGRKRGENVFQLYIYDNAEEIFAGCSEVITVK